MKISQDEIDAALGVIDLAYAKAGSINEPTVDTIIAAIEAAYTVRKQRKAAKREHQRKEKDKQVVESVKPEYYQSSYGFGAVTGGPLNSLFPEITPSKALEWDGTFIEGEDYQMRNGSKATLADVGNITMNDHKGRVWWASGRYNDDNETDDVFDLIRPWPKGEQ